MGDPLRDFAQVQWQIYTRIARSTLTNHGEGSQKAPAQGPPGELQKAPGAPGGRIGRFANKNVIEKESFGDRGPKPGFGGLGPAAGMEGPEPTKR